MKTSIKTGGQCRAVDGKWYRLLDYIPNPDSESIVIGWAKIEEIKDDRV